MNLDIVNRQVALDVLGTLYNDYSPDVHYPEPGSFTRSLIMTIVLADRENFARMAISFPEYTTAVDLYKNHSNGTHALRKIAQI